MKKILLLATILPLLLMGCDMNDLFDDGDVYKTYDGPAVVGFSPLEQEVNLEDGEGEVEIQLIGDQRASDLSVNFSVDQGSSTAEAGVHYNITTPSPVTIQSGTSTVTIVIELIDGSIAAGDEEVLILNLDGADGVDASENLKVSTMFIRG